MDVPQIPPRPYFRSLTTSTKGAHRGAETRHISRNSPVWWHCRVIRPEDQNVLPIIDEIITGARPVTTPLLPSLTSAMFARREAVWGRVCRWGRCALFFPASVEGSGLRLIMKSNSTSVHWFMVGRPQVTLNSLRSRSPQAGSAFGLSDAISRITSDDRGGMPTAAVPK
jgi:hypothetical protein